VKYHGAVVHRRVEQRARDDDPVHERDADAHRVAVGGGRDAPLACTVQEEAIAVTPIGHRDDDRAAVVHECHVRDESLIENAEDRLAVVVAAIVVSPNAVDVCDVELVADHRR
jgi:hypothetical protein